MIDSELSFRDLNCQPEADGEVQTGSYKGLSLGCGKRGRSLERTDRHGELALGLLTC